MTKQINRIVRPAEVVKLVGFTDMHIRRLEDAGQFPRRFKLNPSGGDFGAVGWLLSDIEGWIEARAASVEPIDA